MMEQGQFVEQHAFEDAKKTLSYLEQTCARYPELTLAISLACETPFLALSDSTARQWESLLAFPFNDWTIAEASEFLIAIKRINLHSYLVPSPRYLPAIPLHRKVARLSPGSSNDVCVVAALLSRLREREATWPEMQLFCVQVNGQFKSIQALEDGCIVNSMAKEIVSHADGALMQEAYERALWEGLTQDIAGLMAVHHVEDIVALGDYQDAFIDHFAESHSVYLFPSGEADIPGFEYALGAAVLAEGLFLPGKASEIVERLNIREAYAKLS
ncbi:MAG TPA: DUF1464 family protein [Ktedonobacteraceae bacterium]|nr:DUF1464 family protein [Ktedonobacteraceae bacterium]